MTTPLYRFCSSGTVESGGGGGLRGSYHMSRYLFLLWGLYGRGSACAGFSRFLFVDFASILGSPLRRSLLSHGPLSRFLSREIVDRRHGPRSHTGSGNILQDRHKIFTCAVCIPLKIGD